LHICHARAGNARLRRVDPSRPGLTLARPRWLHSGPGTFDTLREFSGIAVQARRASAAPAGAPSARRSNKATASTPNTATCSSALGTMTRARLHARRQMRRLALEAVIRTSILSHATLKPQSQSRTLEAELSKPNSRSHCLEAIASKPLSQSRSRAAVYSAVGADTDAADTLIRAAATSGCGKTHTTPAHTNLHRRTRRLHGA